MEKTEKNQKKEQAPFHYRARSFRLADETYKSLMVAFKESGKRSWNLFFVDINRKLKQK